MQIETLGFCSNPSSEDFMFSVEAIIMEENGSITFF